MPEIKIHNFKVFPNQDLIYNVSQSNILYITLKSSHLTFYQNIFISNSIVSVHTVLRVFSLHIIIGSNIIYLDYIFKHL
jgi:hypothetical protein